MKSSKKKHTYYFKQKCLDKDFLDNYLKTKQQNWKEVESKIIKKRTKKLHSRKSKSKLKLKEPLDLLYLDTRYTFDKNYYGIKSNLKNMIDFSSDNWSVTNKQNLFDNLEKLASKSSKNKQNRINKYLVKQSKLNLFKIHKQLKSNNKKDDSVLTLILKKYKNFFDKAKNSKIILKYVYSSGGKDVFMLDSYDSFIEKILEIIKDVKYLWKTLDYKKYYLKLNNNHKKSKFRIEWVVQEYIDNPYLINKKKIHFRTYILYDNTDKSAYYLDKSVIATSRLPYKKEDYNNKDIHDTHFYRNDKQINFPDDFKLTKTQINNIHQQLKEISKKRVKCFSESKKCYYLFGGDFLLTDDLQIKLLEFNSNPGCSAEAFRKGKYHYPHRIFEQIFDLVINKHFPKSNKTKKTTKLNKDNQPRFIKL